MYDEQPLPCSEKIAFSSRAEAAAAGVVAAHRYGARVRPYHCRHCDLWHLASDYDNVA